MGVAIAKLGRFAVRSLATRRWGHLLLASLLLGMPLAASPVRALDQVSLQLKFKHQFQFAGYYAALERGFYRDNGLEVQIREGSADIDSAAEVASGKADFGVCTTSILVNPVKRANDVVLAVIF